MEKWESGTHKNKLIERRKIFQNMGKQDGMGLTPGYWFISYLRSCILSSKICNSIQKIFIKNQERHNPPKNTKYNHHIQDRLCFPMLTNQSPNLSSSLSSKIVFIICFISGSSQEVYLEVAHLSGSCPCLPSSLNSTTVESLFQNSCSEEAKKIWLIVFSHSPSGEGSGT